MAHYLIKVNLVLILILNSVWLIADDIEKRTDIDWVSVKVESDYWPSIPPSRISLGPEYTFAYSQTRLPSSFSMMKYEVSCQAMLASKVLSRLRHEQVSNLCEYGMDEAVTGIQFAEALSFCHAKGADLPTESQWVFVASLVSETWLYEYGVIGEAPPKEEWASFKDAIDDTVLGPLGIQGLYGNVWEITRSLWAGQKGRYIIKGGSFDLANKPWLMHPLLRATFIENDIHNQNIGFRCVK